MKTIFLFLTAIFCVRSTDTRAQNIIYSEVEKNDNRHMVFEILGNFSGDFLIYKNNNRRQFLTIYDNMMAVKKNIKLDFISEKTFNIDFVKYPDYFIMVWQYEKGSSTYSKAARMNGSGELMGEVISLDTTKTAFFSQKSAYRLSWSDDRKKVLLYKVQTRNNVYDLVTKIYDENLSLLDNSKRTIDYNDRLESFGDIQIDNEGTLVFPRQTYNSRGDYINKLDLLFKKINSETLDAVNVPLDNEVIQEPQIKIDNAGSRYLINSFSCRKNTGHVDGLFTAIIGKQPLVSVKKMFSLFDDSIRAKLSSKRKL